MRPSWAPGCGCCRPGTRGRTSLTTPGRSHLGAALKLPAGGHAHDHPGVLKVWSPPPAAVLHSHPGRLPAARRAVRTGPQQRLQGHHRQVTPPCPGRGQADRCPRPGPLRARRRPHRDLRRVDAQMDDTMKQLTAAVGASRTTTTGILGVGPVIAATCSAAWPMSRASRPGPLRLLQRTAPIEVSSGNRRSAGCRGAEPATQPRHPHGCDYPDPLPPQRRPRASYDRKLAEGKTHKQALRSLKRRISDTIFARLQADARQAAAAADREGPGGQPGNDSVASAAGLHPEHRLFGQATPGTPTHTTTPPRAPDREDQPTRQKKDRQNLLT